MSASSASIARDVRMPAGRLQLEGTLALPDRACGIVVFSHGSGSGRHSPRNAYVAGVLNEAGLATLLLDLLTPEEAADVELRFDIPLLTERLIDAVRFVQRYPASSSLRVGLFGASTGAASALRAAAEMPETIRAIVSRGGRPDLAGNQMLPLVRAPTLLLLGGEDREVIALNRSAERHLQCEKALHIVPGATHLFEEPGTLEIVARQARDWFVRHLARAGQTVAH